MESERQQCSQGRCGPRPGRGGRPKPSDEERAAVLGEMALYPPRTAAYRAARRQLAVRFGKTERAIEMLFARERKAFFDSTQEDGAA